MVVSLTSAVSVTWHSVGIILRAAAKSVVGDSTVREIRRLSVNHNEVKASNNKLILHYVTAQFMYTTGNHSVSTTCSPFLLRSVTVELSVYNKNNIKESKAETVTITSPIYRIHLYTLEYESFEMLHHAIIPTVGNYRALATCLL